MGSLSSRPSAPARAPVITTPAAVITPVVPDVDAATEGRSEKTASEVRTESLLNRSRSRLGTIATSFRGVLGLSDNDGQKKTLLGE